MNDTLVDLKKFIEKIVASKLANLDAEYNGDSFAYKDEYESFLYKIHSSVEEAISDAEVR